MIKVSNVRQRALPTDEIAYMGCHLQEEIVKSHQEGLWNNHQMGLYNARGNLDVSVHQFELTFLDQ